jgi:ubiquinone/menaquinone biosynthesis C-methylase UbiE
MKATPYIAALQAAILNDVTGSLSPEARVLDVGCGSGEIVQGWLDLGFDAYGCDFRFKEGPGVEALEHSGRITLITPAPYRLPYPDHNFDILLTNQVMEHVRDYPTTLAEMKRVLKPGGYALHIFPARLMPIEPHTNVPLATVLRHRAWFAAWARLGIRTTRQSGMTWQEAARRNQDYLAANTNYLSGGEIKRQFATHFDDVRYVEKSFLVHSPNSRGRVLARLGRAFPPIFVLYRSCWSRVLLARP